MIHNHSTQEATTVIRLDPSFFEVGWRKEGERPSVRLVDKPRLTKFNKYLTDQEFTKVEAYIWKKCERNQPLFIVLCLIMYLGLRREEACTARKEWFKNDWSRLVFVPCKTEKVHERLVPKFLSDVLRDYEVHWRHRMKDGYLCTPYYGLQKNSHIQPATVNHFFAQMREDLQINDTYDTRKDGSSQHRLSPHTMRHYAAWRYYEASGRDILVVKDILGHEKVETTQRYINSMKSRDCHREVIENAFKH